MWYCLYQLIKIRSRWRKIIILLLFFSSFTYVFVHQNLLRRNLDLPSIYVQSSISSIHTADFLLYPESRSAIEYEHIQTANNQNHIHSIFYLPKIQQKETIDYSKALEYSEITFRSASRPIIWLDSHGDIHWNRIAELEIFNYLSEKQFPNPISKMNSTTIINNCLSRQLFLLDQWSMGFFSRYHCFIEHFGQTLYSPLMVLLIPRRFMLSHSSYDDFQSEGILRYFQPISLCSAYLNDPQMKPILDILNMAHTLLKNRKEVSRIHQLFEHNNQTIKYFYSREIWKFGYDHVPHRRWLFDRNRDEIKKILHYNSSIDLFIDHSNEHIYFYNDSSLDLTKWTSRNLPQGPPNEVLPGRENFS
jgi:hypothetical protein